MGGDWRKAKDEKSKSLHWTSVCIGETFLKEIILKKQFMTKKCLFYSAGTQFISLAILLKINKLMHCVPAL